MNNGKIISEIVLVTQEKTVDSHTTPIAIKKKFSVMNIADGYCKHLRIESTFCEISLKSIIFSSSQNKLIPFAVTIAKCFGMLHSVQI